jgi:hypothetical protein
MNSGTSDKPLKKKSRQTFKRLQLEVPRGPYKTKAERWNALDKLMDFNIYRDKTGQKQVDSRAIERWMGLSYEDILREINSTQFQGMRLARGSMKVSGIIIESIPSVQKVLRDFNRILEGEQLTCPDCQKKHGAQLVDMKDKKAFLELITQTMDKFGLSKVDISNADIMGDIDVEEAIQEGMKLCEELYGEKPVVQRFIKAASEPGALSGGYREIHPSGIPEPTFTDDKKDGPAAPVQAVRLHDAVVTIAEEVPVRHNLESPEQDQLDVLRPSGIRPGEASEPEDKDA